MKSEVGQGAKGDCKYNVPTGLVLLFSVVYSFWEQSSVKLNGITVTSEGNFNSPWIKPA